jgi:hypothetical protein
MNLLLVKFMVKFWHRLRWGAINQDGGRLVTIVFCVKFWLQRPNLHGGSIYIGAITKLIYSKLSITTCHEFKTRKWNKYYSTPMSFASHPTLSFRPAAHHALAWHFLCTSYKGKDCRVRVAPPHGMSGTPLKLGNACCLSIFTVRWGRSWANRLSVNPHPAHRASAEVELEERNEGEELVVARTLSSDGTRVDRTGVLSTRTSSTTSWVRATCTCHQFRSPVRTESKLHST